MRTYHNSEQFLERALRTIPLGSQTFSKSKTQYPLGVSPLFIKKGLGSRVWDVDNNEYVDFINGLAAITLGYQDPDVDAAVAAQVVAAAKTRIAAMARQHRLDSDAVADINAPPPCCALRTKMER